MAGIDQGYDDFTFRPEQHASHARSVFQRNSSPVTRGELAGWIDALR
jgi:hypothetical protein